METPVVYFSENALVIDRRDDFWSGMVGQVSLYKDALGLMGYNVTWDDPNNPVLYNLDDARENLRPYWWQVGETMRWDSTLTQQPSSITLRGLLWKTETTATMSQKYSAKTQQTMYRQCTNNHEVHWLEKQVNFHFSLADEWQLQNRIGRG